MLRFTVIAATSLALAGCDLAAAALDYTERYCSAVGCTSQPDGGGSADSGSADAGSADGGVPVMRADTVLFRTNPETTFVVLRVETQPVSRGGGTRTFLEERRLTDGTLVASQPLADLKLALSNTFVSPSGLSPSGDRLSVVAVLYDGSRPVADAASDTTIRRVLQVRRDGLDFSTTIADAFQAAFVSSAATQDGSTFWVSGKTATGQNEVREVAFGSSGTTRLAFAATQYVPFLATVGGRLLASREANNDGTVPSGVDDLGPASAPVSVSAPMQLVGLTRQQAATGFAALDLTPAVQGPDTLYVPDRNGAAGLQKFSFDGTQWRRVWSATAAVSSRATGGCLHVAARAQPGGVVVLCTATTNDRAPEVVRFDDFGVGDAGPTARVLARTEGNGLDGGASSEFHGLAFSPE
jgi:hypothetical protein